MKIVCFSDSHGQFNSKKLIKWFLDNPGDLLLFAGDMQLNNFDDGSEFLAILNVLPYKNKVITFGNHDCNFDVITKKAKDYPDFTKIGAIMDMAIKQINSQG
jgi:predicted phosphodiesterase